jgi:mono/diheme cytochrome c family protein
MFPLRHLRHLPLSLLLASTHVQAQDGEQLYGLYCAACHAPDGKGATGGAFPPLAGSEWVLGNPKRSVAIVLKGLHGPVEVAGKSYNLEMPPQGDALGDDQIAAILNFVHKAWGNKGQEVKPELVSAARKEFASRNKAWTAPELLKLFPLEKQATALAHLTSRVYKGQWSTLPDFSKIEAENVEEEHDGILDTALAALPVDFGIVWEGEFLAPSEGEYAFILDADDGAKLILNGKAVAEVKGLGPMEDKNRISQGKVKLKAGANPIRIEYFQGKGNQGISLGWKLSGAKQWQWVSANTPKANVGPTPIPLMPKDGKTVIYRNFIEGSSARGIGFGFPGGVNMVYSADNLAPALVWAGDFMDAGRHWTDRGQGFQAPMADLVVKLNNQRYLPADALFKGYTLDKQGNPTFHVRIGADILSDSWKPGETGTLIRTLSLASKSSTPITIEVPLGNAAITGSEKITLTAGTPSTITYNLK